MTRRRAESRGFAPRSSREGARGDETGRLRRRISPRPPVERAPEVGRVLAELGRVGAGGPRSRPRSRPPGRGESLPRNRRRTCGGKRFPVTVRRREAPVGEGVAYSAWVGAGREMLDCIASPRESTVTRCAGKT